MRENSRQVKYIQALEIYEQEMKEQKMLDLLLKKKEENGSFRDNDTYTNMYTGAIYIRKNGNWELNK